MAPDPLHSSTVPEPAGSSSKRRAQGTAGQLTSEKGEVFSDYDTSLVNRDYVVGVATSEASEDVWARDAEIAADSRSLDSEPMDLEHMDIPIEGVEAAAPVSVTSRSFTAVTTDDSQEIEEVSGTLTRETCALVHCTKPRFVAAPLLTNS